MGSLSANTVLTCSFNGGAYTSSGCYTIATFSTLETVDWAAAYGSANRDVNASTEHNVQTNGAWVAPTTGSGLTVSSTLGPGYTGSADTLLRTDNFVMVNVDGDYVAAQFTPGYTHWNHFAGMFDAQPDAGAGDPGDHLLQVNHGNGPLQLDFSRGISGALFRISTPTTGDLNATVSAYAVANPTALDIPIMTYSIHATNASGSCAGLTMDPPQPCNLAPYIGIEGGNFNIRSLVISTTDNAGLLIDTLYLNDGTSSSGGVPEPGTFVLSFGTLAGIVSLAKRRRSRP